MQGVFRPAADRGGSSLSADQAGAVKALASTLSSSSKHEKLREVWNSLALFHSTDEMPVQ